MSAVRTRILLGDDSDLLAPARMAIVARADLDVIMAGTTQEAIELASTMPRPRGVILPADGAIDGIEVCKRIKSSGADVGVVLVLAPSEIARRDACFVAGADDVVFAPVDAAELTARLESRGGKLRGLPSATVDLAVHVQGSATGPVLECKGKRISREAMLLELPAGIRPPPAQTLVRAIFTLYEGGTLTLWARFMAPPIDPAATTSSLRFVGVAEPERRALDYFVDFYLKSAPARAAVEEVTGDKPIAADPVVPTTTRTFSGPVEDLRPSEETLQALAESDIDQITQALGFFAQGRDSQAAIPAGFSVLRFKQLVPKISISELSAFRGQSLYPELVGELQLTAAEKMRLYEMAAQLRTGAAALDPKVVEARVMAAIAEAQQVHKLMEKALEARVKAGNTEAMKDIGQVNVGLVSACVELKKILDTEILHKAAPAPSPSPANAPPITQAKFDKPAEPTPGKKPEKEKSGKKDKPYREGSPHARKIAMGLVAVVLAVLAWLSNRPDITDAPRYYEAHDYVLSVEKAHFLFLGDRGRIQTYVTDASWMKLTHAERDAVFAKLAERAGAAGFGYAQVIDLNNQDYGTVPAKKAGAPATPAPTSAP